MKRLLAILFLVACSAWGQAWTPILDPSRATDWSTAGVARPSRSTICSTLSSGATTAQINSAIAACPSDQVVFLDTGNYSISGGLIFNGKSNVTLRGNGPGNTVLTFSSGNSCAGLGGNICVINASPVFTGTAAVQPGGAQAASWTAHYTQGDTVITLDKNPGVGTIIILDQANDTSRVAGAYTNCDNGTACHQSGESGSLGRVIGGVTHSQMEVKSVTAVAANGGQFDVTITPGLHANNWRSAASPGAWWATNKVQGVWIESMTLDHTSSSASAGVYFYSCYQCGVYNLKTIKSNRNGVWFYQSNQGTVRDSYFYGTKNSASQSYAVEFFAASDNLVENNICDTTTDCIMLGSGSIGNVVGYNYPINGAFASSPNFMAVAIFAVHDAGPAFNLIEGNDANGLYCDDIHGTSGLFTAFRNRFSGYQSPATGNTNAVYLQAGCRGVNLVGNVLGQTGSPNYHTVYEKYPGGPAGTCELTVIVSGWPTHSCSGSTPPTDATVRDSLLRWGNYDVVTAAPRWENAEIPTTGITYINANSIPADHTLPNSFYLAAKPSWFGTLTYPPIGPDVTGGEIANLGGHVWKIPARICYENTSSTGGIKNFDYPTCLAAISGGGGGAPIVSLTPTSPNFGSVQVGASGSIPVTLGNIGDAQLASISVSISGTGFTQSNDCGATLNAAATCTITVVFSPATIGAFSGTLTVTSSASTSPNTAPLVGAGKGVVVFGFGRPN